MPDFVFKVKVVAVVRVRAADERVAREVVPTVLEPPGDVEIRLTNENNMAMGGDATITDVHVSVGSIGSLARRTRAHMLFNRPPVTSSR